MGGTTKPLLKIWTTFDLEEKKHFLKVQTLSFKTTPPNLVEGSYMLQDNQAQPWHSTKMSLDENVRHAVDKMVEHLKEGV